MKRSAMPARRSPLRRRSARMTEGDRLLARNRELAFQRDGYLCQAHQWSDLSPAESCTGPLVVHHVLPRSRGGGHEVANLLTLSDWCHRYVHAHPADARTLGLLR